MSTAISATPALEAAPVKSETSEELTNIFKRRVEKMKQINNALPVQHNTAEYPTILPPLIRLDDMENSVPDWSSVQGHFGWMEIDKNCTVPHLWRSGEKFVSESMLNYKVLGKYQYCFTSNVHTCVSIKKIKATKVEVDLLNEINIKHSDASYGPNLIVLGEYLISANDVKELNDFYKFCYNKLFHNRTSKTEETTAKCGFVKIDPHSVPYVRTNEGQFVPLFYFEGDSKYLEDRHKILTGWDLTYLKFACCVQGIRRQLFSKESLQVVDMNVIKSVLGSNMVFEETWVSDIETDNLIMKKKPKPCQTTTNPVNYAMNVNQNRHNPNLYVDFQRQFINSLVKKNNPSNRFVIQIPDIQPYNPLECIPYNFQKYQFNNRLFHHCINIEAFNYDCLGITLEEFCYVLALKYDKVTAAARELGVPLLIPNKEQRTLFPLVGIVNATYLIEVAAMKDLYLKCVARR